MAPTAATMVLNVPATCPLAEMAVNPFVGLSPPAPTTVVHVRAQALPKSAAHGPVTPPYAAGQGDAAERVAATVGDRVGGRGGRRDGGRHAALDPSTASCAALASA